MKTRLIEILMIEDDMDDVILTREALKSAKIGNTISVVRDGEEALAFLRKQPPHAGAVRPDLILLDLSLPKLDGREVLKEIRKDASLCAIPVVVLSASDDRDDILKSYELNANSFVTKPVNFERFREVIQSIDNYWFGVVQLPSET